jgi:hypothetical protein
MFQELDVPPLGFSFSLDAPLWRLILLFDQKIKKIIFKPGSGFFKSSRQYSGSGFIDSGPESSILGSILIRIQGFDNQKLKKKCTVKTFFPHQKFQFTYP